MPADSASGGDGSRRSSRSPRTVVAGLTARKAIRSGVIWGYIFGVAIASSAISYTTIYKTQAQRDALAAAYGSNKATSALFGPAPDLQTVAGFTVFKISMTLMILGAVWGLLTSTRLLRGEEDSGRWELLLAGQTTRRGATVQALAGLGAGVFVLWALAAVITILSGLDSKVDIAAGPALYFALAMVATAVMFLAVGRADQPARCDPTPGRLLRRRVPRPRLRRADDRRRGSGPPRTDLGVATGLGGGAPAAHRTPTPGPCPDRRLHRGAGRHRRGPGRPAGRGGEHRAGPGDQSAPSSASLRTHRSGHTNGPTDSHRLVGGDRRVGIAVRADSQVGRERRSRVLRSTGCSPSSAHREPAPRLCSACASSSWPSWSPSSAPGSSPRHVRRSPAAGSTTSWSVRSRARRGSVAGFVAVAVLLVSGVGAGVFAWLGAASQHAGVSFTTLLEAGVNLVPPAVAISGIGVLAFGIRPRMMSVVVYALLGWSLLIVIVGGIGAVSHWVLDTSVFHQMASAPAVSPTLGGERDHDRHRYRRAHSSEESRSGDGICRANDFRARRTPGTGEPPASPWHSGSLLLGYSRSLPLGFGSIRAGRPPRWRMSKAVRLVVETVSAARSYLRPLGWTRRL